MELRSRPGISGSQTKPRATSEGRKAVGTNRMDQADNVNNMTCVNSPSSPTGIARGGKSPSRILPTEGGRFRAFGPQPRSESAGGADRSPEGDHPRRRGQTRESGDAGGRATPGREPVVVSAESGKHHRQPDEGRLEFTHYRNYRRFLRTHTLAHTYTGKLDSFTVLTGSKERSLALDQTVHKVC